MPKLQLWSNKSEMNLLYKYSESENIYNKVTGTLYNTKYENDEIIKKEGNHWDLIIGCKF